jgi:mono/diheme cytochrome c family protein
MQNDSYNRGGYYAFLFSMIFSLGFFVYVTVVHPGINLKEVSENQDINAPVFNMAKVEKPWEENKDVIAHGAELFANTCATCHGKTGLGDGPGGKGLTPPPRNFVEGKWKNGGDSINLFKTLQTGIPGSAMVSFKAGIPPKDRWALVQFIRSITHNKTPDDAAKLEAFGKSAD